MYQRITAFAYLDENNRGCFPNPSGIFKTFENVKMLLGKDKKEGQL